MGIRQLSRGTALACAVILAACNQPNGPDSDQEEIPVQSIVTEQNSGFVESDRRVIRDAIAWATVWARIYEKASSKPSLP